MAKSKRKPLLELRKGRDGQLRPYWYGRLTEGGKRRAVNLGEWQGTPPATGKASDMGDATFERSRAQAEAKLEQLRTDAAEKGRAEHLTARLIEMKTGRAVEYAKIADLPRLWRNLRRDAPASESWLSSTDVVFKRFAEFVTCEYLHEVSVEHVAQYAEILNEEFSHRTASGSLSLLRSAFRRFLPVGAANPFEQGISRKGRTSEGRTSHRRPLDEHELANLFEIARDDDFMYPLIVTAACTGLRRGDVCRLNWRAVDLREGLLNIETGKTGAAVSIPIFAPLREVLEGALASREDGCDAVFPDAAKMIETNPDGLTWRFKKLVADALEPETAEAAQIAPQGDDTPPLADSLPEIEQAVNEALPEARAAHVVKTLRQYATGDGLRLIEIATGRHKSQLSADIRLAEKITDRAIMRYRRRTETTKARIARLTRADVKGRARAASVYDWHALRTTFVTLALMAGVPIEVCRAITGHGSVEIVLRHYFRPGAGALRAVLADKMPKVLTGE